MGQTAWVWGGLARDEDRRYRVILAEEGNAAHAAPGGSRKLVTTTEEVIRQEGAFTGTGTGPNPGRRGARAWQTGSSGSINTHSGIAPTTVWALEELVEVAKESRVWISAWKTNEHGCI